VVPAGSRTCTPADPTFTTADVVPVSSPGTFPYSGTDLRCRAGPPSPTRVVGNNLGICTVTSDAVGLVVATALVSFRDLPAVEHGVGHPSR
jgi:hypothetical protein